ncbi:MAG: hypothetical protein ACREC9_00115 [Methylocella sp.]
MENAPFAFRGVAVKAADLLNGRVIHFFDSHEVMLLHMLTGRGSEHDGGLEVSFNFVRSRDLLATDFAAQEPLYSLLLSI